jgi:ketosteroid isomerase-like protein
LLLLERGRIDGMSSEERRSRRGEVVSRLYREGWGPGDFDIVRELLHDDIVWTAIEGAPDAGTYRGFESVRAYMQDWLDEFDFNEGDDTLIEESIEVGDRLVCLQRVSGTGKRSGLRSEIRYACVYTFGGDDRILEVNEYATLEEALEAASSRPAPPSRPANRAATRR